LRLRDTYAEWDAEQRFDVPGIRVTDPQAAQCGEVLKGVLKPHQCKLFGRECTPEHPIGALMVSSEGSCAAYFNYEHRKATLTSLSSIA
jgi:hydrogenase expression/formation protein HypD